MRETLTPPARAGGRYCFVCGPDNPKGLHLQFYRLDDHAVTTEFDPPAEWCGWDGLMHGGLQCVLLDEVTAWAVSGLRQRPYMLTLSLEVKYRQPVRLGQKLVLVGRIISESERGSKVLGQILNQDGLVLSEATVKIIHVNEDRFTRIIRTAP